MSTEMRAVYAGLLVGALFWALLSGILLLNTHEVGRWAAWYWAAVFVGASFAAAWLFFELLEGGA